MAWPWTSGAGGRPIEVETVKMVENSYRAALLAFMHEWSVFAERAGVDLLKIIDIVRQRPTHNNMLFPGPGIGVGELFWLLAGIVFLVVEAEKWIRMKLHERSAS